MPDERMRERLEGAPAGDAPMPGPDNPRIRELEEALAPFAKALDQLGRLKAESPVHGQPALGVGVIALKADFIRAAYVLEPRPPAGDPEA